MEKSKHLTISKEGADLIDSMIADGAVEYPPYFGETAVIKDPADLMALKELMEATPTLVEVRVRFVGSGRSLQRCRREQLGLRAEANPMFVDNRPFWERLKSLVGF